MLALEFRDYGDCPRNRYRGRETMCPGWLGYFSMVPDYTIEVQEAVADGRVVIVVGTARGTYFPDGNLDPADRGSTPGAWRAVVASGHVAVWQVFADNEPIRQIMRRYGKETALPADAAAGAARRR